MPPSESPKSDRIRVRHMLDAIEEALSFVKGKTRRDLNGNRMLVLSLIKEIEMMGEAASKVSEDFQGRHPEIPWSAIVGTRNRLIHGYFDIDLDIVWKTLTEDLPQLAQALGKIL